MFAYEWTRAGETNIISNSKDLANQEGGSYTLKVTRDGLPCFVIFSVNIPEPAEPLSILNIEVFDETCISKMDGKVEVTVDGGWPEASGLLEYTLDGGASFDLLRDGFIEELGPGNYNISIRNSFGCNTQSNFTIGTSQLLLVAREVTNVTCYTAANGSVDLLTTGGDGNYEYSIDGGNIFQDISKFIGLEVGDHTFISREKNSPTCESNTLDVKLIQEPEDESACGLQLISSSVAPTCSAVVDGSITIIPGSGIEPYTISWTHDLGLTDFQLNNLAAGTYAATVMDDFGTVRMEIVELTALPELIVTLESTIKPLCFGTCDGFARVSVTGGSGNYRIIWPDNVEGDVRDDLCADTYNLVIEDTQNPACQTNLSFVLEDPAVLAAEVTNINLATCAGDNNASAEISVSGESGFYTIVWPDGQTGALAVGLLAGQYDVMITDDIFSCGLLFPVIVPETPPVEISNLTLIEPVCFGENGSIFIELANTSNPLIQWSNGVLGANLIGVPSGDYTVEVIDANGCTLSQVIALNQPNDLLVDEIIEDPLLCFEDSDASLLPVVSGGIVPYRYSWSLDGTPLVQGTLEPGLNGLVAGEYELTVRDDNECKVTKTYQLTQPEILSIENIIEIEPNCFGEENGSLELEVVGGTPPYEINWDTGTTGSVLNSIGTGSYTVDIIDFNGCAFQETLALGQPAALLIIDFAIADTKCVGSADGEIDLTVVGGIEPYTYQWSNGSETEGLVGVVAGDYSITITDTNGCTITRDFIVGEPIPLIFNAVTVKDPTCFQGEDGLIQIEVLGGTPPFTYQWSNADAVATATNLKAGTYELTVIDANGCQQIQEYLLTDPEEIFITGMPEVVETCEGGRGLLEPDDIWSGYAWTFEGEVISNEPRLLTANEGIYHLEVTSALGCTQVDSVEIRVTPNPLNADFVLDNSPVVDDILIFIEVSQPVPDEITWTFPEGTQLNSDPNSDVQEVIFPQTGNHMVGLEVRVGDCTDYVEKEFEVTVFDEDLNPGGRTREEEDQIQVSVYPNPNSGEFTVEVDLKEKSPIDIVIQDFIYGSTKAVYSGENNLHYKADFNLPGLIPGIYFIRVETAIGRKEIRFIVNN